MMPWSCAVLFPFLNGCKTLERWLHLSPTVSLRRAAGSMTVPDNTVELALVPEIKIACPKGVNVGEQTSATHLMRGGTGTRKLPIGSCVWKR